MIPSGKTGFIHSNQTAELNTLLTSLHVRINRVGDEMRWIYSVERIGGHKPYG